MSELSPRSWNAAPLSAANCFTDGISANVPIVKTEHRAPAAFKWATAAGRPASSFQP